MKTLDRFVITDWFMHLQDRICQAIEKTDGKGVFEEEL